MKSISLVFSLCLLLLAVACTKYSMPFEPSVNLKLRNHNAADSLIAGLDDRVTQDTPIVVATISNINKLDTSSALGRTISDQVMTRFVEKGFTNISEIRLRRSLYLREKGKAASGEFLLSRDARAIAETRQAGAVITGTYTPGYDEVLVSLRFIEVASGKVLSSYDYKIPMNTNIEELLDDGAGIGSEDSIFSHSDPVLR